MQREDVERLARLLDALSGDCAHTDGWEDGGATCTEAAISLRALLAERDAAFAAGQESMRERAALEAEVAGLQLELANPGRYDILPAMSDAVDSCACAIRALAIKPRP